MTEQRRWYIIQTASGMENSVKRDLIRRIESMNMKDYIFQIVIPEETIVETKADGTKKEKIQKMYPGYIFVEMIVTDESWFIVRNTPKVTGFLGSSGGGAKPVPLPSEEINAVLESVGLYQRPKFELGVGDKAVVKDGPFQGQVAEIIAVNEEKEIVTLAIDMFGRNTPTDFTFNQVEKAY